MMTTITTTTRTVFAALSLLLALLALGGTWGEACGGEDGAGGMVLPFATAAFMRLPLYEETRDNALLRRGDVDALLRLLSAAGVDARVGVSLLHRHFAMEEGELLVERVTAEQAYAAPERRPADDGGVLPYTFRVLPCGRLEPLEHVVADAGTEPLRALLDRLDRDADGVLPALGGWLAERGLTDVFGLGVAHRDALRDHRRTLENSDEAARWLLVRAYSNLTGDEVDRFLAQKSAGEATETFCNDRRRASAAAADGTEGAWCRHSCYNHVCFTHRQSLTDCEPLSGQDGDAAAADQDSADGYDNDAGVDAAFCGHDCQHACSDH